MDFASSFNAINNTTTVLVNTTGFFRVFGTSVRGNVATGNNRIFLSDGFTTKVVFQDSITTYSPKQSIKARRIKNSARGISNIVFCSVF